MPAGRIFYFTQRQHAYTLNGWFDPPPGHHDPELVAVAYDGLQRFDAETPAGTYVFTDLERLEAAQMKQAVGLARRVAVASQASGGAHRIANWPNRTMHRVELLGMLHRRGVNRFRCWPILLAPRVGRFPVFLRIDRRHDAAATELLNDHAAVRQAVERLLRAGVRREDILAVEFQETDRIEGRFVRYSCYHAFGEIFPAALAVCENWVCKGENVQWDEQVLQLAIAYTERNPHAAQLIEICALAGVQWGRLDYGLSDGALQIFEINTNPDLLPPGQWAHPDRRERLIRPYKLPNLRAAFRRLANPPDGQGKPWR